MWDLAKPSLKFSGTKKRRGKRRIMKGKSDKRKENITYKRFKRKKN